MSRRRARARSAPAPLARRPAPVADFVSSSLRQLIVVLVLIKVAALVLLFDPLAAEAFDLPKAVVSGAVAWLLGGSIAAALLRYGPAIVPSSRVHLAVLGFLGVNLLSTAFAEDRYVAVFGQADRFLGLAFVMDMVVLYFATAVAFRARRDWLLFAVMFGVAGLAELAYAGVQRLGLDRFSYSFDERQRPFATLGNPDQFGLFLIVLLGLAVGVALWGELRWHRAAGALLGLLTLAVITIVATRANLLGIAGLALAILVVQFRLHRGAFFSPLRLVLATTLAGVILLLVFAFTPLGERAVVTLQGTELAPRLVTYRSAFDAFRDRPILGYGPDDFMAAYSRFRLPEAAAIFGPNIPQSSAHSWLLQTAATTGVAGLVSVLTLIATFGVSWWRSATAIPRVAAALTLAYAAYWVQSLVSVGTVGADWFPWFALGGLVALTAPVRSLPPLRRRPIAGLVLVSVVAVAGAASGLNALQASHDAALARAAWMTKRAGVALDAAAAAVRRDAGRADYWNWLGLAYDLLQRWGDASDAYNESARRMPYLSTPWSNLALSRTHLALGGDTQARALALDAARRGVAADPNDPTPHARLAEVAAVLGEYDEGLRQAVKAIELFQSDVSYDRWAAQNAVRAQDQHAALALLDRAVGLREASLDLRLALAQVCLNVGNVDGARANARRALELQPGNAEAERILKAAGG